MSNLDYMDKLLDGVEVAWKTLADITLPTSNIKWRDIDHTHRYIDLSSVSIETKKIIETSEVDATNAPSRAQKIVQEGDVIFATTRPTQMRYCLIDDIYSGQVASTGYCVLRPQINNILPKWILYCIASKRFKSHVENNESGAAYPAISDTKVKTFEIPIPPLEIQAEIIQILDAFTELTAQLTAELVARKQQYAYYRDKLFNFNDDKVEWKTLGVVSKIQRGASPRPIAKYVTDDKDGVPWIKIGDTRLGSKYVDNTAQRITLEGAEKSRVLKKGSFIMSNSMSYGRPYILGIEGAIHDGWASISDFESRLNPDFLYHYLSSGDVKNYWESKINSSSVSNLNSDIIKALPVPIPSIDEQERIAYILDKFDTLTTSLTEGLPREIELRQQQYEYYRELLLNFPKVEGNA